MAKQDASAFVRMTTDDKVFLKEAIALQLAEAGLAGARLSVPDFMLAAALKKAREILGHDRQRTDPGGSRK